MRIIAKAKPIRIRVKSGGEEHSSLESLRRNLCVQDLWPLIQDKRLSRWLRQLGEMELAHEIDALSEEQLDDSTYFKVLSLFLKEELEGQHITDLYSLFSYWHDCEMGKTNKYKSLCKHLLDQYNGAKFLYRQYATEISDGEWWNVFCKFEGIEDPEFLFAQGKLAFDGFKDSKGVYVKEDVVRGKKLIEKAAELHHQEAMDFMKSTLFNKDRKLSMLTPEAKGKIDSLIARWKTERLGFVTKKAINDEEIVWAVKQLLREFTLWWYIYQNSSKKELVEVTKAKYENLDESDVFYKERKFVLDLVQYSYGLKTPHLFVKLAEDYRYPLAQYMIRNGGFGGLISMPRIPIIDFFKKDRIDGFCFVDAHLPDQLVFIVNHLFKY